MQGIHAEKCLRQVKRYNGRKQYKSQLIVHTDGGGQYRSNAYQEILRKAEHYPVKQKHVLRMGWLRELMELLRTTT